MPDSNDVYEQEGVLQPLEDESLDSPSHFSYRVVLNESVYGVESTIYEVYFDDAGNVEGWIPSRNPYGFDEESIGKSISELRDDMEMMLAAFENETYFLVMDGEEEYLEIME